MFKSLMIVALVAIAGRASSQAQINVSYFLVEDQKDTCGFDFEKALRFATFELNDDHSTNQAYKIVDTEEM
ncbi:hypothetical protein [Hyphomonas oceanitis]|uniref:Lipoprotein n=1 Tax=Hyphomonas oceanitis SCH89 TaxID=1280953 RepID=A0A059G3C0_9PROT|nr:hypothetical protein [Hyphomonas oceanitis]KDA00953.1 hypothetical protein HOC_18079 [Hyphomonas oceanitis SCH89]